MTSNFLHVQQRIALRSRYSIAPRQEYQQITETIRTKQIVMVDFIKSFTDIQWRIVNCFYQ